jgi:multidrug resistance efflux pump
MSRRSKIAAIWLLVCCVGSLTSEAAPVENPTAAADDADFALKVFEKDLIRIKRLSESGSVPASDLEVFEDRVLQARSQAAIARGDKAAQIELLKSEIDRQQSRLSRIEKLRQAAVVSADDVADAKAAVQEAEMKLARVEGDRAKLLELIEAKVSYRNSKLQRVLLLRQKGVVGETDVALERLNLAKAKNELAVARGELQ